MTRQRPSGCGGREAARSFCSLSLALMERGGATFIRGQAEAGGRPAKASVPRGEEVEVGGRKGATEWHFGRLVLRGCAGGL